MISGSSDTETEQLDAVSSVTRDAAPHRSHVRVTIHHKVDTTPGWCAGIHICCTIQYHHDQGEIGNILGPSQVVMESMSHVGGWRWWRAGPRPSLWRWRRERVAVAGARMRSLLGDNLINLPGTRTTPPCPPLPRPPPSTHKILSRAPPLVTIRIPSQSPQSLSQS